MRKVRRVYLLCFLTDTNELHSHAVCRDAVNMCTLCAVHACRVVSSADMFTEGPHISTRLCAKPVKHPAIRVSTCVHTYTHIAYIHCVRRGSGKRKKKKKKPQKCTWQRAIFCIKCLSRPCVCQYKLFWQIFPDVGLACDRPSELWPPGMFVCFSAGAAGTLPPSSNKIYHTT